MSLSDIISALDSTLPAQAGLLIFLLVFAAVIARLMTRRGTAACRADAMLPLEDGAVAHAQATAKERP